jgi:hypothetical protein
LVVRRNRTRCTNKYVRILLLRGVRRKCRVNYAVTGTNKAVHMELCSNGVTTNYTFNSAITRGNKEVHLELSSNG